MTREIKLTRGYVALVDDDIFDYLKQFSWHVVSAAPTYLYARRTIITPDGRRHGMRMHREIMGAPAGVLVDHINRDTLDNRRQNLRIANHAQNASNSSRYVSRSGYRGVALGSKPGCVARWVAHIRIDGKLKTLGRFDDPISAAHAYDQAARDVYGEFATTNFAVGGKLPRDGEAVNGR